MPDSVKKIGFLSFGNCTSLKSIKLSANLEEMVRNAFENCTSLESIAIPKNLKTVITSYDSEGVFEGCTNLKTVTFEEGTEEIPDCLFRRCTGLETIIIPDCVNSLGEYSFADCESLERVYLPKSIIIISNSAFQNCPNVTVFCPKYLKSMINLIDNRINCVSSNDKRLSDTMVLETSNSYYNITSSSNLSVSCAYRIQDNIYGKASNLSLKIYIPTGAEIVDESFYLDKVLCENYTEKDNYIQIPVTSKSGKITFKLDIIENCKLQTYAILNYTLNGKSDYDIIDVINEDVDLISLNADDVTSNSRIKVSGIAPVEKDVRIYADNEQVATLKANKVGSYSGEVTIPNAEDGKSYVVKAVSMDNNGNEIFASISVLYQENAPELTEFTMTYNGKTYDLMSGKKNNIVFRLESAHGQTPFRFKAKYKNEDNIDSVYITSSRNQIIKKMKATWDENEKAFVAAGFFDDNDHDYVPGKIGVQYIRKSTNDLTLDNIEEEFKEQMPDELKNATHEVIEDNDKRKEIIITLSGGETVTYIYEKLNFEEFESSYENAHPVNNKDVESVGSKEFEEQVGLSGDSAKFITNIIKYGWGFTTSGIKKEYYTVDENEYETVYWDHKESTEYVVKETLKYSQKKIVGNILTKNLGEISGPLVSSSIFFAYDEGKEMVNYYGKALEYNQAIAEVRASSLSESEKAAKIAELQNLKNRARDITCIKMIGTYMKFVGALVIAECPPLGIALWVSGFIMANVYGKYPDFFDGIASKISSFFGNPLNFSIDPSGYVYAAVTSNRIEGATVTAYWIPFDEEDETYWDNPDETKAVVWDSDEYSQYNPLTTDAIGNYAWDVPEGWWKVKVEKDGYETYTTEWLPVPPPQTDVNINLLNKTVPEITSATVDGSTITLQFSEYMNPETLQNLTIKDYKGNDVTYTLSYSTNETSYEGTVYAKEFSVVFNEEYQTSADYYTVEINHAKSYSDVEYNGTAKIGDYPFQIGDTNLDGYITISDVTAIQRHLAEVSLFTDEQLALADTNGDDKVDISDATHLQKYIAEFDGIVLGKS